MELHNQWERKLLQDAPFPRAGSRRAAAAGSRRASVAGSRRASAAGSWRKRSALAAEAAALAEQLPSFNPEIINLQNDKGMELKQNIREFTEENPEIAAQLLKNWLNGGVWPGAAGRRMSRRTRYRSCWRIRRARQMKMPARVPEMRGRKA